MTEAYTNKLGEPLLRMRGPASDGDFGLSRGYVEIEIPENVNGSACNVFLALETMKLLAMIDTIDPDAMRAYLRETVERTFLENMGVPAVEHEVPEADSPEDVDEHPEPVITVTPEALDAAEQLGRYVAEIRDAFARGIAR